MKGKKLRINLEPLLEEITNIKGENYKTRREFLTVLVDELKKLPPNTKIDFS